MVLIEYKFEIHQYESLSSLLIGIVSSIPVIAVGGMILIWKEWADLDKLLLYRSGQV